MRRAQRFQIIGPAGVENVKLSHLPSPEAVLSKALTLAMRHEEGTWLVREWEDTLYRIRRVDNRWLVETMIQPKPARYAR